MADLPESGVAARLRAITRALHPKTDPDTLEPYIRDIARDIDLILATPVDPRRDEPDLLPRRPAR